MCGLGTHIPLGGLRFKPAGAVALLASDRCSWLRTDLAVLDLMLARVPRRPPAVDSLRAVPFRDDRRDDPRELGCDLPGVAGLLIGAATSRIRRALAPMPRLAPGFITRFGTARFSVALNSADAEAGK